MSGLHRRSDRNFARPIQASSPTPHGWDGTKLGYHQHLLGGYGRPPEGVIEHGGGVRLEYHHPNGERAAIRYRSPGAPGKPDKHWWAKAEARLALGLPDDWTPNGLLYRVEFLTEPEPLVVVCEGESSTLALWAAGVPAVGVPGAGTWDAEDPNGHISHLIDKSASVLVIADPDTAGKKLVEAIASTKGTEDWRMLTGDGLCDCECDDVRQVLLAHGPGHLADAVTSRVDSAPWLPKTPGLLEGHFTHSGLAGWVVQQNGRRYLKRISDVSELLSEEQVDQLVPQPIRPPGARMRTLAEPAPEPDPTLTIPGTQIRLAKGSVNSLFGDQNSGKTLTAAEWAARFATAGHRVAWIAVEGPVETDRHLRAFLAGDADALARVAVLDYWPASPTDWAEVIDFRPTLVVVDSLDAAIAAAQLGTRNLDHAVGAIEAQLTPIGATKLWLDHSGHQQGKQGAPDAGNRPAGSRAKIDRPRLIYRLSVRKDEVRVLSAYKWKDLHGDKPPLLDLRLVGTSGAEGADRLVLHYATGITSSEPTNAETEERQRITDADQEVANRLDLTHPSGWTAPDYDTTRTETHPAETRGQHATSIRQQAKTFAQRMGYEQTPTLSGQPLRWNRPDPQLNTPPEAKT